MKEVQLVHRHADERSEKWHNFLSSAFSHSGFSGTGRRYRCVHVRHMRRHGNSDDAPQLLIRQLVDRHDLGQLLGVSRLVLHEVGDADVLHVSQRFEPFHIFIRHLQ